VGQQAKLILVHCLLWKSRKKNLLFLHTHFQQFTYFQKNDNFEDIKIQSSIDSCQYLHFLFFINMLKIATNFSIVDALLTPVCHISIFLLDNQAIFSKKNQKLFFSIYTTSAFCDQ